VIDIPKEQCMPQTGTVEWVDALVTEIRRSEGEDLLRQKYIMILAERDGDRTPQEYGSELASCPVAAAEMAAEVRQRILERYGVAPSMR
jgi:hypothetical protein